AKEPAREAPLVLRRLRSSVSAPTATVNDLAAAAARLRSTIVTYWGADDSISIWVVKADGAITSAQVDVRRAKLAELIQGTTPFAEGKAGASRAAGHVNTRGSTPIALPRQGCLAEVRGSRRLLAGIFPRY